MNHEELKILVNAYYDGEATAEEKAVVETHLKECGECRKFLQGLRRLSSTLKNWSDESLSPDVSQKIHQEMGKFKEGVKMQNVYSRVSVTIATVVVVAFVAVFLNQNYYSLQMTGRLKSPIERDVKKYPDELAQKQQITVPESLGVRVDGLAKVEGDKAAMEFKGQKTDEAQQYEPYYLSSGYRIQQNVQPISPPTIEALTPEQETEQLAVRDVSRASLAVRSRQDEGGFQAQSYEAQTYGSTEETYSQELAKSACVSGWCGTPPPSPTIYYPQQTYYPPIYTYPAPSTTEEYGRIDENEFLDATQNPLSTLSIDVDTASYSNIRRFLNQNQLPPKDAVRIEEMINYFTYDYPQPSWGRPFSITTEVSTCPWNPQHELVLVGIQGKTLENRQVPPSNLVFLIDVSGSMADYNKLPLVKQGFKMLVNSLRPQDKVSIVVYAGSSGVVLDSVPGHDKYQIIAALDRLQAGGSTAGGQGIQLAYQIAQKNFIHYGNNRVILATDGDFNVGVSSEAELVRLIEEKRNQGIFLTVLGFGMGNYKDSKMEQLADKGNGNYAYIDNVQEAQKVMVNELGTMLFTIAKDVKIQIEFNPNEVKAYRLIGYENRLLAKEDFNDDTKDAGELGAGHTVTALYEVIPAGAFTFDSHRPSVDPLKYQATKVKRSDDLMTIKLRYKEPRSNHSQLITKEVNRRRMSWAPISDNFQFASAVAEFGLLLRDSKHKGNASYQSVLMRAQGALGHDPYGYRQEFLGLVQKAQSLDYRHRVNVYYPPNWSYPQPQPVPESDPIKFKGE